MLRVKILGARNLSLQSLIGNFDPSCSVTVSGTTSSTSITPVADNKKSVNPVWNKTFIFTENLSGVCQVIVNDCLDSGSSTKIGTVSIPLDTLIMSTENRQWFKLSNQGGEIEIALLLTKDDIKNNENDQLEIQIDGIKTVKDPSLIFSQNSNKDVDDKFTTLGPYQQRELKGLGSGVLVHYNMSDLKRDHPHIARGGFGMVFKGKAPGTNDTIVIKDLEIQNQKSVDDWKKEVAVMCQNRSPYIAEIYGYASENNTLTIVMEYFEFGDLFGILHKKADKHPLSLLQRMRMARHCTLGVAFLHKNHFIHRDIKSMNFLVRSDYACKLTDFGCAKLVHEQQQQAQLFHTIATGTPFWMSPEVKSGGIYSFPADVYSLGIVLYELFQRELPNYDNSRQSVVLPTNFRSAVLVLPCVHREPNGRPTTDSLLNSLDSAIRRTLEGIYKMLPEEDRNRISSVSTDSLDKAMIEVYRYFLSMDPKKVDEMIDKSFMQAQPRVEVPQQVYPPNVSGQQQQYPPQPYSYPNFQSSPVPPVPPHNNYQNPYPNQPATPAYGYQPAPYQANYSPVPTYSTPPNFPQQQSYPYSQSVPYSSPQYPQSNVSPIPPTSSNPQSYYQQPSFAPQQQPSYPVPPQQQSSYPVPPQQQSSYPQQHSYSMPEVPHVSANQSTPPLPPKKSKPLPSIPLSQSTPGGKPPVRPADPVPGGGQKSIQDSVKPKRDTNMAPGKIITIVSAKDLRAADLNGKSDPYCKIKFDKLTSRQFKTQVIDKTLEPTWNYVIPFPIPSTLQSVSLFIEVWDKDFKTDDFLGSVEINLDVSKNANYHYNLVYKNNSSGTITLMVSDE